MFKRMNFAIGSVAGTFARFFLGGIIYRITGTSFSYGTLMVILTGYFLIGVFSVLAEEKFLLGPNVRILLMIGFYGAFTTFQPLCWRRLI